MGGNGTGKSVSPGQVFVDTNPATKPEHKFKLNVLRSGPKRGVYVYGSADGFRFEKISGPHIPFSDSQAVIYFEPGLAKCKCSRSLCVFFRKPQGSGCTRRRVLPHTRAKSRRGCVPRRRSFGSQRGPAGGGGPERTRLGRGRPCGGTQHDGVQRRLDGLALRRRLYERSDTHRGRDISVSLSPLLCLWAYLGTAESQRSAQISHDVRTLFDERQPRRSLHVHHVRPNTLLV